MCDSWVVPVIAVSPIFREILKMRRLYSLVVLATFVFAGLSTVGCSSSSSTGKDKMGGKMEDSKMGGKMEDKTGGKMEDKK